MTATSVKVLLSPSIKIATIDLSDQCSRLECAEAVEDRTIKVFVNGELHRGGIRTSTVKLDFVQGFDVVDAALRPLIGTVVAIDFKPDSGSKSAANPEWTGNVLVKNVGFVAGAGEEAVLSVELPVDGGILAVATT